MDVRDRYAGCLLGGAVGDALGAPLEFLRSSGEIRRRYGPSGLADYAPAYGRLGAITDDTQMTLFTAEGLLRADNRFRAEGIHDEVACVHRAYLRWLRTQGVASRHPSAGEQPDGWLDGLAGLHASRAPGRTCMGALMGDRVGTIESPVNDSKGCGGVMRMAPVGLAGVKDPFRLGCDLAAITHGHPSGYLAAGCLALCIHELAGGADLRPAIDSAVAELERWRGHEECLGAVERALDLASKAAGTSEAVETLGEGWVAEEALAIAFFCALVTADFARGVPLAINHKGDSDSTGAITGNILGALRGKQAIPGRWLDRLELGGEIETVAADMARHFAIDPAADARTPLGDEDRYPGS